MQQNKQKGAFINVLLLIIAIMLSGSVFAAKTAVDMATQAELDAAVAAQATNNTTQQAALDDLKNRVDKLTATLTPKKIGEHFGGGIIFHVDASGQHGLIAAFSDFHKADGSNRYPWYNGVFKTTGASGNGFGAGQANTLIIVAAQASDNPTGIYAAKLANDFSVQADGLSACTGSINEVCYGDWYLPSLYELNQLYHQQAIVGGFEGGTYHSSTEATPPGSDTLKWSINFLDGFTGTGSKDSNFLVRAIRAF